MELLSPSPPPRPAADHLPLPPPARCRDGFAPAAHYSRPPEAPAKVHVAVGRSPEKTAGLLQWTFRRFGCREIGLVHVHQPSPTIPTLLGKIPASRANEELVSAYRREEVKQTKNILLNYLRICHQAQVTANIIMIETEHVQKGIVNLVTQHGIRKLVMGAAPDNCLKVKRSFSKVSYTEKNVPLFCEIWFISNGKHVWTREASEDPGSLGPVLTSAEPESTKRFRSSSLQSSDNKPMFNPECTTSQECKGINIALTEADQREEAISTTAESCFADRMDQPMSRNSSSTASWLASPTEGRLPSEISLKEERELELLHDQLREARAESGRLKKEAFTEIVKRKKLDSEAAKSFSRMKVFEVARAHEIKLCEELEAVVKTAKRVREELLEQRDEAMRELQNAMRTITILDSEAQEVALRRDEAAGELKLIQASIMTLRSERQKIRREREEALHQLDCWRSYDYPRSLNCDEYIGFANESFDFREFSLSDIQTATCNFSESFKLGQRYYGCIYKGEMSDKSVVIKQLHPHNVQGQLEFQKEVYVLSKLRHPHLVSLIGMCPEAWSLVFEYMANGRLEEHLVRRTSAPSPLTWKARARIAAQISSALLFLHSSKPERIIHGNLSPENIFLDSDFNCKIGNFGICQLVPDEAVHCPSFCRSTEPKGAFTYADPEYQRTGVLTEKSDVYSFGIIVLQLLTGRPPLGLANEVRRAMPGGKLSSVLDPTAGEWPLSVALRLAEFGLHCSEMNSRDRPELTPVVVRELDELHVPEERPVPSFFLCPILKEIMHDPQVAADGFTYEGRAIRGWLENGRETSPMTNLKLDHLDLTPNHALRFAIQDWLSHPRER